MWLVSVFLVFLPLAFATNEYDWTWDDISPLDDYVNRDDDADVYEYSVVEYYDWRDDAGGFDCEMWTLNFTSQRWMTPEFSDKPVWFHYMAVAIPGKRENFRFRDSSLLYISGGRNNRDPPNPYENDYMNATCKFAQEVGSVAAYLRQIPNAPVTFADDSTGRARTEDAIIAWTWRRFYNDTSNPDVILQLPMTKSAVKAMDTVSNFVGDVMQDGIEVDQFFVSGGSKRGWIAWLAAAVDRRVMGVAPIVLSCLNMQDSFEKHYRSLGGWSWVLRDYWDEEIFAFFHEEGADLLEGIVDPYSYRSRLTMPKVVVQAAGDEFFLPDDSHLFYDDLPEPKYMMMVENNDHPLPFAHPRIFAAFQTFFIALKMSYPLPQLSWSFHEDANDGSVIIETDSYPANITGWVATTLHEERRDFRLVINGGDLQPVLWFREDVEELGQENTFRLTAEKREDSRFKGLFINVRMEGPEDREFDFTTEVNIIPDVLPFEMCDAWECMEGDLV